MSVTIPPDGFPAHAADTPGPRLADGPHSALADAYREQLADDEMRRVYEADAECDPDAIELRKVNLPDDDYIRVSIFPPKLRTYRDPRGLDWYSVFVGVIITLGALAITAVILWGHIATAFAAPIAKDIDLPSREVKALLLESTAAGMFSIIQHGVEYPYATFPAHDVSDVHNLRVTCYSPVEGFPDTNQVCRGGTVRSWVDRATEMGLDGICAAGGQSPWYWEAKYADPPIILHIQDHGDYLCVDRMARRMTGVDIWVPNLDVMWSYDKPVWRVTQ